jgi:hypothetical protein
MAFGLGMVLHGASGDDLDFLNLLDISLTAYVLLRDTVLQPFLFSCLLGSP